MGSDNVAPVDFDHLDWDNEWEDDLPYPTVDSYSKIGRHFEIVDTFNLSATEGEQFRAAVGSFACDQYGYNARSAIILPRGKTLKPIFKLIDDLRTGW